MNVLFIMNGIGSVNGLPGISGGDVRWIEIAKCWQRDGYDIHVFTPQAGVELCKRMGLEATFHVSKVPNEYSLRTYLWRFLKSRFIPKTLNDFEGIVYSTTEHIYDTLPALRIKENGKGNVWVAVVHWVAPLGRNGTSLLNSVLFLFNQRLGFRCIRNGADVVLAISENTAKQVKRVGVKKNVFPVGAGVDFEGIRKIVSKVKRKKYDAVFMKRFDGTKGVFDVIEIWKEVVKRSPEARLGMIGLGAKKVMNTLNRMVENYGITHNVDFLGPIYDLERKFSILASSKLFVLPSYEENWAIVIGEAMAAGVPVICYDLPEIKPIWKNNVIWVPRGDKIKFAGEILRVLNNGKLRKIMSKKGREFVKKYDWHNIADEEMKLILFSIEHTL